MKKTILMAIIFSLCFVVHSYAKPIHDNPPQVDPNEWDISTVWDSWRESTVYDRSSENENIDTYEDYFGYTGDDYEGYYLGTIEGNTNPDYLESAIEYYIAEPPYSDFGDFEIYKVDDIDKEDASNGEKKEGPLKVTWDDNDYKSGTWDWSDTLNVPGFYSVKGSTEFALYFADLGNGSRKWTTRHLLNGGNQQPGISHFSVAANEPTLTQTPEPATMLLFGTGLIGLAWVGRRQMQRRKDA